jgi:hypothetical protein
MDFDPPTTAELAWSDARDAGDKIKGLEQKIKDLEKRITSLSRRKNDSR